MRSVDSQQNNQNCCPQVSYLRLRFTKFDFGWAHSAPPDPLAQFKELRTFKCIRCNHFFEVWLFDDCLVYCNLYCMCKGPHKLFWLRVPQIFNPALARQRSCVLPAVFNELVNGVIFWNNVNWHWVVMSLVFFSSDVVLETEVLSQLSRCREDKNK